MPVQSTCIQCQKEFLVKPYQAESRKFCSAKCKNDHHRVNLICEKCGDPFWAFKSSAESQSRRFCSMSCRSAVLCKPKPPKKERVRITKVCKTCSIEFNVPPSRSDSAQFCSQKCKGADLEFRKKCSDPQSGEKANRWSGGVYKERRGYLRKKVGIGKNSSDTFLHRAIVAEALFREAPDHPFLIFVDGEPRISPAIHVHHIDRVRNNNELSNLLAVTAEAHSRIHSNGTKPHPWECWPSHPTNW